MKTNRILVTTITAALTLASGATALAGESYSFPSASGALIVDATPRFAPVAVHADAKLGGSAAMSPVFGVGAANDKSLPLPVYAPARSSADGYSYRFLTHALASQSFANYAADYYRIFTPGYAVTEWTDRVYGIVGLGYGGAIDGWTAGAHYMGKVRGPSRRKETAPDLSVMPTFRAHPELQENPSFSKGQ
jgi:hypothetical protein